jgi:hypothetical protein
MTGPGTHGGDGLVMLGGDGVVCEGDACILPVAAAPGRPDAAAQAPLTEAAGARAEHAQP